MPLTRVFHPAKIDLNSKNLVLSKEASSHLLKVLRLKAGDPIVVFDGTGHEYLAKIKEKKDNTLIVELEELKTPNTESRLQIILGQGISRGEKMDFTIQKAVELGVFRVDPLFTEHGNVRLEGERLERRRDHWQKIAISACEQSGRTVVPEITMPQSLTSWLAGVQTGIEGAALVGDPESPELLSEFLKNLQKNNSGVLQKITLLVGPEGGLSSKEILAARNFRFSTISLGPRTLRTETAGLVALSIIQSYLGDL